MPITANELKALCAGVEGLTEPDELVFLYEQGFKVPFDGWFVELGSYRGRSGIAICQCALEAKRLWRVCLIDNFTPIQKKGWADKRGSAIELRRNLSALGYYPAIVDGDSRVIPEVLGDEGVALLNVDSDHNPEHFHQEMDVWLPRMLAGSIIVCHDYANPNCGGLGAAIDDRLGAGACLGVVDSTAAFKWKW